MHILYFSFVFFFLIFLKNDTCTKGWLIEEAVFFFFFAENGENNKWNAL